MSRLTIAVVVILILAALLGWQNSRYRMVDRCIGEGGFWDGASSRCRDIPPPRIYIERDLKRS